MKVTYIDCTVTRPFRCQNFFGHWVNCGTNLTRQVRGERMGKRRGNQTNYKDGLLDFLFAMLENTEHLCLGCWAPQLMWRILYLRESRTWSCLTFHECLKGNRRILKDSWSVKSAVNLKVQQSKENSNQFLVPSQIRFRLQTFQQKAWILQRFLKAIK